MTPSRHLLLVFCAAVTFSLQAGQQFTVTTPADSGPGSLRQAILDANATPLVIDGITSRFGVVARPTSALPEITGPVIIEFLAVDGSAAGSADGLVFTAGGNDIDFLTVTNFAGNGVVVRGSGGNHLTNLNIGMGREAADVFGPNGGHGLVIENTVDDRIGGVRAYLEGNGLTRNTIVGSGGYGIVIRNVTGLRLESTWVGVRENNFPASGMTTHANGLGGIHVVDSTAVLIFGEDSVFNQNAVAGNGGNGLELVNVTKSTIGPNTFGTVPFSSIRGGNEQHGIVVDGGGDNTFSGNQILFQGGAGVVLMHTSGNRLRAMRMHANAGDGIRLVSANDNILGAGGLNTISENGGDGIVMAEGSRGNRLEHNWITDSTGAGLRISESPDNIIGIPEAEEGNVVARNRPGIVISGTGSTGNLVQHVAVGDRNSSSQDIANVGPGILITGGASRNTIGSADAPNRISRNTGAGIAVESGSGNRIGSNKFAHNGGLPIDLGNDGRTFNDMGDGDLGPNELQNAPSADVAYSGAAPQSETHVGVEGVLRSHPNRVYAIQLFLVGSSSIFPIATTAVTTDAAGVAPMRLELTQPPGGPNYSGGDFVLTATDSEGNTSEMSREVRIRDAGPVRFERENYRVSATAASAVVTVVRHGPPDWTASVKYRTLAEGNSVTSTGTLVFVPGETRKTISVPITDAKPFDVEIFETTGGLELHLFLRIRTTVTIVPSVPQLSVADIAVDEGDGRGAISVVVSADAMAGSPIRVDYKTVSGSAREGEDFIGLTGTIEIPNGQTSAIVSVPIVGDIAVEGDEELRLVLSNPVNAELTRGEAVAKIHNDDGVPVITADDVTVNELASLVKIQLRRSGPNRRASTVFYHTVFETASSRDFVAREGAVVFAPDQVEGQITFSLLRDQIGEMSERFYVDLVDSENAILLRERITVTLLDPGTDPLGAEAGDVEVLEGNSGERVVEFVVRLSRSSDATVPVLYSVDGIDSTNGLDFQIVTGTLTFAAGEMEKRIAVPVLGDVVPERTERFQLTLDCAAVRTQAVGRIINDDGPALRAEDATFLENAGGVFTFEARVTIDPPSPDPIAIQYKIHSLGSDADTSFGSWSTVVAQPLAGFVGILMTKVNIESRVDPPERLMLTIRNPDFARVERRTALITVFDTFPSILPALTVTSTSAEEPVAGMSTARFVLELSRSHDGWVAVEVETTPGTASAADFMRHAERVVFAPGEMRKVVDVPVVADALDEQPEWFFLVVRNVASATIAEPLSVGTIYDPGEQPRRRRGVRP